MVQQARKKYDNDDYNDCRGSTSSDDSLCNYRQIQRTWLSPNTITPTLFLLVAV